MSDAPPLIASRYRVIRELGRGGMGVVYVVEHTRTGDQVALKLLHGRAARDPQAIERFKREARASARIKSEHVVKVLDADVAPELENAPFLVMELLNGDDLEKQIKSRGRMPPDQAMHVLSQVARALDKSHAAGIIHRDLKPENLFVHHREDGSTVLKILDFGISKILGGDAQGVDMTGAGMTSTGSIMGTPLYMSPEQARGRVSDIGAPTDVWAIGLITLFLLTGEVYWRANTVAELMAQILSDPLYPPTSRWPWLPQGVDGWFAHSCARDPKQRFQSVGQQVQGLGAALGLRVDAPSQPEASAGWKPVPGAPSSPTGPAAMVGAGTTGATAAPAQSAIEGNGRSRAPLFAGIAVVVLAGVGTTAWVERARFSGSHAATDVPPAASSALAAVTPPAPSAPSEPSASPSAVASAPGSAEAGAPSSTPDAGRPAPWRGGPPPPRPPPQPPAAQPPAPAAQPAPQPAPAPKLPPATYNPAAP